MKVRTEFGSNRDRLIANLWVCDSSASIVLVRGSTIKALPHAVASLGEFHPQNSRLGNDPIESFSCNVAPLQSQHHGRKRPSMFLISAQFL